MTDLTARPVCRPGRRALFPEALPDPEGEAAIAIASLRFTVTLADRSITIDLTALSGRKVNLLGNIIVTQVGSLKWAFAAVVGVVLTIVMGAVVAGLLRVVDLRKEL